MMRRHSGQEHISYCIELFFSGMSQRCFATYHSLSKFSDFRRQPKMCSSLVQFCDNLLSPSPVLYHTKICVFTRLNSILQNWVYVAPSCAYVFDTEEDDFFGDVSWGLNARLNSCHFIPLKVMRSEFCVLFQGVR